MNWSGELKRFTAFNAVGAATTLVGLPIMAVLDAGGVSYPVYTALNYLLGIVLGFWLNFRFAFADRRSAPGMALVRYLVTYLSLFAAVQGLQWLLIDQATWPRWWGVGLGMILYGGLGYVLSRGWVFRPQEEKVNRGGAESAGKWEGGRA